MRLGDLSDILINLESGSWTYILTYQSSFLSWIFYMIFSTWPGRGSAIGSHYCRKDGCVWNVSNRLNRKYVCLFACFGSAGDQTQGLTYARQTLCHLSTYLAPRSCLSVQHQRLLVTLMYLLSSQLSRSSGCWLKI